MISNEQTVLDLINVQKTPQEMGARLTHAQRIAAAWAARQIGADSYAAISSDSKHVYYENLKVAEEAKAAATLIPMVAISTMANGVGIQTAYTQNEDSVDFMSPADAELFAQTLIEQAIELLAPLSTDTAVGLIMVIPDANLI